MEKSEVKRKFLVATHGTLASGIKSSLDLIIGAMDNVELIQAYVDENVSLEAELIKTLDGLNDDEELIVFTDLLGGSVTNQVLQHIQRANVHVVAGFNLPLVIDVLMADTETPVQEIIDQAIEAGREQMVYVNKLLAAQTTNQHD